MGKLVNGLPKSQMTMPERDNHPLVGSAVIKIPLPTKADLSDWVDLMEVVEALCPKWPARVPAKYTVYKL
jgi:hypothetical protein